MILNFFFPFSFFLPRGTALPDQSLTGRLELGKLLQIFAILMKAPKRNQLGKERGVCFSLMRILSLPAGETAGVLSCPSSPALASPVLHLLAATRRREGFSELWI